MSINYYILRQNRKTLTLTVYPDLRVVVKAPKNASKLRIKAFVMLKNTWIKKQLEHYSKFEPKHVNNYEQGDIFLYLGQKYNLDIVESKNQNVKITDNLLVVNIKETENKQKIAKIIDTFYKNNAAIIFEGCLTEALNLFDEKTSSTKFELTHRKMKRRWGSFTSIKNKITLNTELIKASKNLIIYVIVHELCHFTHMNHSKSFYNLMEQKLPNYKLLKKQLEQEMGNNILNID